MESDSFRSSSVLSNLNTNIQEDVIKRMSPLSVSKSLKSSSSSSDNEIECGNIDQENKPPGGVESTSSTDDFKFKKPSMLNEDNTLNSLIDGLSHLKLGSTSASEKRFNSSKWTTPLKKKVVQSNESRASDCSSFEKPSVHSIVKDKETFEKNSVTLLSNKLDEDTSTCHNDDDYSDYYDCSDEENVNVEQACTSEISADSSFHSVSEKENVAGSTAANSTLVMNDSNSVNQAVLADMNQSQDSDQAYILEKYLTEQDFKLEISLSDVSFNTMPGSLDFELGKRQSVCSQIETPVAGSLFSFELQQKSELCSTEHRDGNDVTIQPDRCKYMGLFAKENEPQTENALFNLLTDCLVQNETGSLFDANVDENIFALGRLSQAGFLQFNDDEKDALIQQSTRKSLQLQVSNIDSNQSDVHESQENHASMQENVEIETAGEDEQLDRDISKNEIATNSSVSYRQQNVDQFSSNFKVTACSDEEETSNNNSSIHVVKTSDVVEIDQSTTFKESFIADNQSSRFQLNETINPDAITTIDEIFTEMNMNSEKLNESVELQKKTASPSSLNATFDAESIDDNSLSENSNVVVDLENTQNIAERDLEQNNDLPKVNQTYDSEVSQNFNLEMEEQNSFHRNLNVTVNLEKKRIIGTDLVEQSQDVLKSDLNIDSETSQAISNEIEVKVLANVRDNDENSQFGQVSSRLSITTTISEKLDEMCANEGKSNEFVDSNTIPVIDESITEQCLESEKNLTVNSEITEVIDGKSPHQKHSDEVVSSDSCPVTMKSVYKRCQEMSMRSMVNFETTELTRGTIIEQSPNQGNLNESFNSEISPVQVANLAEQSQESLASQIADSEITEAEVEETGFNLNQPNELVNSKSTLVVGYNVEQHDELTAVIDENGNKSEDEEFNGSVNSISALNRKSTVGFNFDVQIVNNEITKNEDDAENEKSTYLETTQVSNQRIVDRSQESIELSQIDNSVVASTNEEVTEDSIGSVDLNKSFELKVDETLYNDSLARIRMPSRLNETINLEITSMTEENVANDSNNLNKTIGLESEIDKTTLIIHQQQSYSNETIDTEITQTYEEIPDEFTDLDQQNKTINLENPAAIEVDSSELTEESSHLNETVDMEVTRTYEESSNDFTNLDQQSKTIDLENPTAIEVNSSELTQKFYHLNETVDMEITRNYEESSDDFTNLDQRNKAIDLETRSAVKVNSSVLTQENFTIDMEVTQIVEENHKDIVQSDKPNQTVDSTTSTTFEHDSSEPIQKSSKLNETVDLTTIRPTYEETTPYSSEAVTLEYDTDAFMKMEGIATVVPIFSTESVLKNSSRGLNIAGDDSTFRTIFASNQNDEISNVDMKIESNEEPTAGSSNLSEDTNEEYELLDSSSSKSYDNTVIIHESPLRRCNSPARFDKYTSSMPEPASPIPPNSPIELSNKWRTQFDLSSVANHLESYVSQDSPSSSDDEMDVTDPIDSNVAPEMLQMPKQPPGINRSISNLESIPEMNEIDSNNTFEVDPKHDTKDTKPFEAMNTGDNQIKPEAILNQTVTSSGSVDHGSGDELNSTLTQTSLKPECESGLNESVIGAALNNANNSMFKTPIAKLPTRSDLSSLNDSNFNADYYCARTVSAKSTQSSRNLLVSPKFSLFRNSPSIYSPFCTPSRRLRQGTPKASGDVVPSLLDMSIGCFESYTANQVVSSVVPENELNKTVDADEEPRREEVKLLCLEDPSKKVNVKTQTHDTELFDLRAENTKLKEELNGLMEISQTMADKEAQFMETLQALIKNEAELKLTIQQLEDNNRILNNKYELLTEYSNQILARRNAELDEAEQKIRVLESKLQEYTKKTKTSSK